MKIVSLLSVKGGVGKTAAAVNLAYLAASEGYKTLLIDLDPQGSASFYFKIKPKIDAKVKKILNEKKVARKIIKGSDYENLDVIPSDISYRKFEFALADLKKSRSGLKKFLASFKKEYDFIFIDSPPNINLISENLFIASDIILSPVIPTTLSLSALEIQLKRIKKRKSFEKKFFPFFSMYEGRKKMQREALERKKDFPNFLNTIIPYQSDVEKMGLTREPAVKTLPNGKASKAFKNLWIEVFTSL